MKKVAVAQWENRVAPVFDVARSIEVWETEKKRVLRRWSESISVNRPVDLAFQFVDLGVDTLICGAISRSLREVFTAYGIHVIPNISGTIDGVLRGWMKGRLEEDVFAMPGCRRQRRTGRGRHVSGIRGLYRHQFMSRGEGGNDA